MVNLSRWATALLFLIVTFPAVGQNYQNLANTLRSTFEAQLFTLPAIRAGHYSLRMYRQTGNPRYAAAIWSDMACAASTLNHIAYDLTSDKAMLAYALERLRKLQDSHAERARLRQLATARKPMYLVLGAELLWAMTRADEYGLKHREDKTLRVILRRHDFTRFSEDPVMIRVWAAQLANQVYWLRQLGEADTVNDYIQAFRSLYPHTKDNSLSDLEYGNKIYGMTHLIFAASRYYQEPVQEAEFQWIYDYFRTDIQTILQRTKPDIIAEVGLCFLLARMEKDPVVIKTRETIAKVIALATDNHSEIIPAVDGSSNLEKGEHRNVLAIMLLGWQGTCKHPGPVVPQMPQFFPELPWGLIPK